MTFDIIYEISTVEEHLMFLNTLPPSSQYTREDERRAVEGTAHLQRALSSALESIAYTTTELQQLQPNETIQGSNSIFGSVNESTQNKGTTEWSGPKTLIPKKGSTGDDGKKLTYAQRLKVGGVSESEVNEGMEQNDQSSFALQNQILALSRELQSMKAQLQGKNGTQFPASEELSPQQNVVNQAPNTATSSPRDPSKGEYYNMLDTVFRSVQENTSDVLNQARSTLRSPETFREELQTLKFKNNVQNDVQQDDYQQNISQQRSDQANNNSEDNIFQQQFSQSSINKNHERDVSNVIESQDQNNNDINEIYSILGYDKSQQNPTNDTVNNENDKQQSPDNNLQQENNVQNLDDDKPINKKSPTVQLSFENLQNYIPNALMGGQVGLENSQQKEDLGTESSSTTIKDEDINDILNILGQNNLNNTQVQTEDNKIEQNNLQIDSDTSSQSSELNNDDLNDVLKMVGLNDQIDLNTSESNASQSDQLESSLNQNIQHEEAANSYFNNLNEQLQSQENEVSNLKKENRNSKLLSREQAIQSIQSSQRSNTPQNDTGQHQNVNERLEESTKNYESQLLSFIQGIPFDSDGQPTPNQIQQSLNNGTKDPLKELQNNSENLSKGITNQIDYLKDIKSQLQDLDSDKDVVESSKLLVRKYKSQALQKFDKENTNDSQSQQQEQQQQQDTKSIIQNDESSLIDDNSSLQNNINEEQNIHDSSTQTEDQSKLQVEEQRGINNKEEILQQEENLRNISSTNDMTQQQTQNIKQKNIGSDQQQNAQNDNIQAQEQAQKQKNDSLGLEQGKAPIIKQGDDHIVWVHHLHRVLQDSGMNCGDDDVDLFYFGEQTKEALLTYQAIKNVPQTGYVDDKLWQLMLGDQYVDILSQAKKHDNLAQLDKSNPEEPISVEANSNKKDSVSIKENITREELPQSYHKLVMEINTLVGNIFVKQNWNFQRKIQGELFFQNAGEFGNLDEKAQIEARKQINSFIGDIFVNFYKEFVVTEKPLENLQKTTLENNLSPEFINSLIGQVFLNHIKKSKEFDYYYNKFQEKIDNNDQTLQKHGEENKEENQKNKKPADIVNEMLGEVFLKHYKKHYHLKEQRDLKAQRFESKIDNLRAIHEKNIKENGGKLIREGYITDQINDRDANIDASNINEIDFDLESMESNRLQNDLSDQFLGYRHGDRDLQSYPLSQEDIEDIEDYILEQLYKNPILSDKASPTLMEGDGGYYVYTLQLLLEQQGFSCSDDETEWQSFGEATTEAVKCFQSSIGLPETGVADEMIWEKLIEGAKDLQKIDELTEKNKQD